MTKFFIPKLAKKKKNPNAFNRHRQRPRLTRAQIAQNNLKRTYEDRTVDFANNSPSTRGKQMKTHK